MDGVRHDAMAKGVDFHQRSHPHRVAKVVAVLALGQGWAGRRLHAADGRIHLAGQLLTYEGESKTGEVRSAASATHQQVRGLTDLLELKQRFLTDHGLVKEDMVEDTAQ